MNEYPYFNPNRKHHEILLKTVEDELMKSKEKAVICKFGARTQHIFMDNKYVITINWGLV